MRESWFASIHSVYEIGDVCHHFGDARAADGVPVTSSDENRRVEGTEPQQPFLSRVVVRRKTEDSQTTIKRPTKRIIPSPPALS
jgi:hypothetical protein